MNGFKNLGMDPAVFVNTVRASLPEQYKQSVPVAVAGQTSFTGIGEALAADENFANTWHKAAINLVSKILQRDNKIVNPLAEFEGELITTGDKIEEMVIDAAETFMFNPKKAERKLFERRAPELKAAIHKSIRDVSNARTIQDTVYTDIFRDVSELDRYVVQVTQSMLSGNEYEKYYTTKELVSRAVYNGGVRTFDMGSRVTAKELQKQILKFTKLMVHPSRYFNMGNVGQPDNNGHTGINIQADFSQLRMLLPVTTSVDLNVDFFASAFHLDAVKSGLAIKEVDYFPDIHEYTQDHIVTDLDIANGYVDDYNWEPGDIIPAGTQARESAGETSDVEKVFDGSRIQAVILDRRALIINPMLPLTLTSQANPLGRYTNIILQDKSFYSFSPFMPAIVILADEPAETGYITDVQIDGDSVVSPRGVAKIEYSDETLEAAQEVFNDNPEVCNKKPEDQNIEDPEVENKKTVKKSTKK